ncbi:MAG: transposase [Armatimonadia bacterium]
MPRKRFTPEQIIGKLREAEVELAKGATIAQVARKLEITEHTYYRWRTEYGGMCKRRSESAAPSATVHRPRSVAATNSPSVELLPEPAGPCRTIRPPLQRSIASTTASREREATSSAWGCKCTAQD